MTRNVSACTPGSTHTLTQKTFRTFGFEGDVICPTKWTKICKAYPFMNKRFPHTFQGVFRQCPRHRAEFGSPGRSAVTNKQLKNTVNTTIIIKHLDVSAFSPRSVHALTKRNVWSYVLKDDVARAANRTIRCWARRVMTKICLHLLQRVIENGLRHRAKYSTQGRSEFSSKQPRHI